MKPKKRYQDMTSAELAEATREYDREWPGGLPPGREMTPAERTRFERRRKQSLARDAAGSDPMTLLFPHKLTERICELAKARKMTPANLVKRIVHDAVAQALV